jgi:hypothetical protein
MLARDISVCGSESKTCCAPGTLAPAPHNVESNWLRAENSDTTFDTAIGIYLQLLDSIDSKGLELQHWGLSEKGDEIWEDET